MIQRKQSIFLLLAAIIALTLAFGDFVFYTETGTLPNVEGVQKLEIQYDETINNGEPIDNYAIHWVVLVVAGFLSFVVIFFFKSRKTQANLTRLAMALFISCLVFMYYDSYALNPFADGKGSMTWLALPPIACAIFTALALRGIKKDEALVRSVDRLR